MQLGRAGSLPPPAGPAGDDPGHRPHQRARAAGRAGPGPPAALMAPMTRSFVAAIEAFVAERGLDLVTFERGERKDDRTQEYLRAWPGGEGVLYVGKD